MANIVFKGHKTRGEELYKLLKFLGGTDSGYSQCGFANCYYYINREGFIESSIEIPVYMDKYVIMTLEKFESKYPYKVGDKVRIPDYESEVRINIMRWDGFDIQYGLFTDELEWYSTTDLNSFNNVKNDKEENMRDKKTLAEIDLTDALKVADEVEVIIGDYEFVLKDGRTYFIKKKPKYPKTYEECCKVLLLNPEKATYSVYGLEYKRHLIVNFQRLLVCRDAYWKLAGIWKYDINKTEEYFYIVNKCGRIMKEHYMNFNHILAFPTEEMRDAFYENFKELIEECKELL